jgi:hypothetical protein
MKSKIKLLSLFVTEWNWAMRQPQLCRAALLAHKTFKGDNFTAEFLHAMIVCGGNWRAAVEFISLRRGCDFMRLKKLELWLRKITAPKKRGLLLEWKGGVS